MLKKIALKKLFCLILPILTVFSLISPAEAASNNQIRLVVDGRDMTASASPVIVDGRTLVPVRFISERIGAQVAWDGTNRTVTVSREGRKAFLRIGSHLVEYDGGAAYGLSDVAPKIINDRTFVPLRLIGNALGIGVDWDEGTRTVIVDSQKSSAIVPFFNVRITSLKPGDAVTGKIGIQVSVPDSLRDKAKEIKLLLLDRNAAKGFVVAVAKPSASNIDYLPRVEDQGAKLLVAALYDENGAFIGGDLIPVNIEVQPRVLLTGLEDSDVVKNTASISQTLNFLASYVSYEFKNLESGKVTVVDKQDPQGTFVWEPVMEQNGSYSVRVIAYDGNGNAYESKSVKVKADVDRKLSLRGVAAGQTINQPVTLLASRNFDVTETQYVLRDVKTGQESVLATIPYGEYVWFPGPEFSGDKELSVRVRDIRGVAFESSPIKVMVDGSPKVLLQGIGPKQVVTGETKLSLISNVKLDSVSYVLTNTATGEERTLVPDLDQGCTFTPSGGDPPEMTVQAQATYRGRTITSERVPFKIYLGTLYGPRAIIEKDKFLGLASDLAKGSSKETGMSSALQVAQAILETGWGQSVPVDKYSGKFSNNLFGIKGTGPNGSVISNTWEVYNGVSYRIDAAFKAYHSVQESWNDRNNLLLTASRYAPFREVMHDHTLGAWAVKRAGYATDPLYPVKLINIIKQYN
ncbi:MAG: stalk domain-containing protein, partial [Syntrophomonadaceae bacterium]|nr:stalk domain-containing protein [Syntrophomonadaceae bacterium]